VCNAVAMQLQCASNECNADVARCKAGTAAIKRGAVAFKAKAVHSPPVSTDAPFMSSTDIFMADEVRATVCRALPAKELGATKAEAHPREATAATTQAVFMVVVEGLGGRRCKKCCCREE
jgi:hypothetical protein